MYYLGDLRCPAYSLALWDRREFLVLGVTPFVGLRGPASAKDALVERPICDQGARQEFAGIICGVQARASSANNSWRGMIRYAGGLARQKPQQPCNGRETTAVTITDLW